MWGKVPFQRTRKPSGVNPSSKDVRGYQTAPPTAQTRAAKALPSPSSSQLTAPQPEHHPRVASSVYSRDTVIFDHHRQRSISDTYQFPPQLHPPATAGAHSQGTGSADVSPPDSPISRVHSQDSSRVSPIEDTSTQATYPGGTGSKFASQIPVPRMRVDSQPGQQPPNPTPRAKATRWDDFSGEPTASNQGRYAQATPSSVSFEKHGSTGTPQSTSSKIIGWGKEQLNSRRKPSESRNRYFYEATPFAPRDPWRGQSGRSATINPIEEKPRNRSSSRLRLSRSNDRLREMNSPSPVADIGAGTVTTTITAGEQNRQPQPRIRSRTNTYDTEAEPASRRPRNTSAVGGTAPPRVDLTSGPPLSASLTDLTLAEDDVNEPTSRFSVTTYNPTEAGSPTPSTRNSITPSPPASIIETASQPSEATLSVMSRSRPVPSMMAPGKRPIRKPTPSEVPSEKGLPPNPSEMTAQDRIEMLEAKRNDLVRRRMNINTIINELTQVIQPSSVAYDMAAREEVKKTVTSLNTELAEIKKEEHDIGLKILRAWKKREKEDVYGQSSSLWVKRVTS